MSHGPSLSPIDESPRPRSAQCRRLPTINPLEGRKKRQEKPDHDCCPLNSEHGVRRRHINLRKNQEQEHVGKSPTLYFRLRFISRSR